VRPQNLIVVGAGAIGLELAQAYRRLGTQVTVLEAAAPLAREDPECAAVVLDALAGEGVVLRSGVAIARVERADSQVRIVLAGDDGDDTIEGSHLLIAAGRRANVEGLGLEQARIAHDAGKIVVDERLKTSNRRVYAIGDAAGRGQFTHLANYHAGLVIRSAVFGLRAKIDADTVPRVTFTDPELAHVGLSEAEARGRGLRPGVLRWPYHENDRAQAERETAGHIKVVTDGKGRILGATIVGAGAGELITAWTLALTQGLNIRAFAGMIVPYPTLAEIGKRAAITYFTRSLTSSWVRRFIRLVRLFG
jgi:pyruvate/2-oxoglutarate dehydrogenase complex dihydrolipoamide dehydrogenase (E3) component